MDTKNSAEDILENAPEQPAVPQDGGELDINIEPEQEPTVTTTKPDELQVPDVPTQPKSPKPDELKTPKIGTAPEKPADPEDDDSMDSEDDFTGGITSPNTTNMTGQQNNPNDTSTEPSDGTQTFDPGTNQSQADVAMGLTTPGIATQTFKGKVGKTRQQSKTNQDSKKRTKKAFPSSDKDDETDFKDMLRFNPAKYRDPLDLEKYKGGMGRQLGALGGEQ